MYRKSELRRGENSGGRTEGRKPEQGRDGEGETIFEGRQQYTLFTRLRKFSTIFTTLFTTMYNSPDEEVHYISAFNII